MSVRIYSVRLFILMAALMLIAARAIPQSQPNPVANDTMGTLVTADWLSQHLNDSDLIVLDCTVRMVPKEGGGMESVSGRADYEKGHIPNAGFADLTGNLSDVDSPLNFVLPTAKQFCEAMSALGVGDHSRVVLYDGFNSVWAARIWWMLKWVGFDRAALLDGGLRAWTTEGRQLSTDSTKHKKKKLTPNPRPALIANQDEVFAAINDDAVSLIDVMPEAHYRGEMIMYDRPGHIPGAVNISAMALVDESGHYRSHDELAAMFDGNQKARAITYCGAGVAASSNAFIMLRLGFENVAVYMGSLQEWAANPDLPLVVNKH